MIPEGYEVIDHPINQLVGDMQRTAVRFMDRTAVLYAKSVNGFWYFVTCPMSCRFWNDHDLQPWDANANSTIERMLP